MKRDLMNLSGIFYKMANDSLDVPEFKEFDLRGMRVIVYREGASQSDVDEYVKYLDEGYFRLKAKGLESAWYGNVFIDNNGAGGKNEYTGGAHMGHYRIREDLISFFQKPSSHVTYTILHELGHRYWFKQMSQEQRGRFESLVKSRTTWDTNRNEYITIFQPRSFLPKRIESYKNKVLNLQEKIFNKIDDAYNDNSFGILQSFIPMSIKYIGIFSKSDSDNKFDPKDSDVWLFDVKNINQKLQLLLESVTNEKTDNIESSISDLKNQIKDSFKYISEEVSYIIGRTYLDKWADEDKEWFELSNDPRPVSPVTDYGKTNIDEAFAEVFAHYCMNEDMDRDQLESFKAVLKRASNSNKDKLSKLSELFYKKAISSELSPLKDEYGLYLLKFKHIEESIYELSRKLDLSFGDVYEDYIVGVGGLFVKYFPGYEKDVVSIVKGLPIPGSKNSEGIFFMIHDLVHLVLEKDFLSSLKRMNYNNANAGFVDCVYEDIVSSLDMDVPPENVKQYILEWLGRILDNIGYDNDSLLVKEYRAAIISFMDGCKRELRGIDNGAVKQMMDGVLSKYKKLLLDLLDKMDPSHLTSGEIMGSFYNKSKDIDSYYSDKLLSANVLSQGDGSSLKDFLRDSYSGLEEIKKSLAMRYKEEIDE